MKTTLLVLAMAHIGFVSPASVQTVADQIGPATHCREKVTGKPVPKNTAQAEPASPREADKPGNDRSAVQKEPSSTTGSHSPDVPDKLHSDTAGVDTSSGAANLPEC
jgi:hypothetical protein